MRLKTYFVDTVEEAMLRARSELGDEAMLVHSKRNLAQSGSILGSTRSYSPLRRA
jgi:flagellar biosynthesis GTPase FlhF